MGCSGCSTCAAPAALCSQLLGCAHPLRVAYAWAWKADCFVAKAPRADATIVPQHKTSCFLPHAFFVLLAAGSLQAVMAEGKYSLPCTSAALLCLSLPFFDCKAKRGHWFWSFTHPPPIPEVAHGGCAPPHLPHKPTMCSTCAAPAALLHRAAGLCSPIARSIRVGLES